MPNLTCSWGSMAYTDAGGSGRPFLFLHGSGCDAQDWDAVIAQLPPGPRCLTMDFRGHGASDAPGSDLTLEGLTDDVLALVAHLDLRDVVLVGHSLGGCVAMLAAQRSDRVTALILLEGWTNGRAEAAFADARLYGGLGAAAIRRVEEKLELTIRRIGAAAWKRFGDSGGGFDAYPYLQSVRIPVAEVYGDAGRTPDTEKRLEVPVNAAISWRWVKGAGHYLPQANPRAIARICGDLAAASRAP